MYPLLADVTIDHSDNKNDAEEDQRGGAGPALAVGFQRIVDEAYHGVQNKANGVHKTLKSPVGTTRQFIEKMRAFYKTDAPILGVVIFAEPDCKLTLPELIDNVALLTPQKAITYIKNRANALKQKEPFANPAQILHCTGKCKQTVQKQ